MGQLEDIQVFVRVVEAGGIGKAAEQMGVAKSAVSRRLVELENRLGVRLLNRTTRKSSLTETGMSYYERAIKVIDDITELNTMASDANAALEGTLRIAAPLSFGISHLGPAIDSFIREHPEISIHIDFSDRHIDLIAEGIDLAFRISNLKDSSLKARRISPIRITACASPEYLKKHGSPDNPDELKNHQLLHYDNNQTSPWKMFDQKKNEYTVSSSVKMTANNGEFLKDMAVAGHGIIISPTFITWQAIATGELVQILTDYSIPSLSAYAVYTQTRYLSQRTRVLINFLVERFGDNPYWDQNI